jgi:hypothetical protein
MERIKLSDWPSSVVYTVPTHMLMNVKPRSNIVDISPLEKNRLGPLLSKASGSSLLSDDHRWQRKS